MRHDYLRILARETFLIPQSLNPVAELCVIVDRVVQVFVEIEVSADAIVDRPNFIARLRSLE